MSVLQVTENVLASLSQHVIHHIIGDMDICFGVLIMFSVVQLKNIFFKKKDKNKKGNVNHSEQSRLESYFQYRSVPLEHTKAKKNDTLIYSSSLKCPILVVTLLSD